tara:strand:+ start:4486 stop:4773 length:288 start_codon:yes stop_codon:yes gene_type:complete
MKLSNKLTLKPHRKVKAIDRLTKKALKDKPKWKPSKGYKYLKDLEPGTIFKVGEMKGILLESSVNAKVIIIESAGNESSSLGKKLISAHTEVKEV